MKTNKNILRKWLVVIISAALLLATSILLAKVVPTFAKASSELDYTFETVPVETINITADGEITKIQPRQSFTVSYEVTPWYTTTSEVYFDILPRDAATVTQVSEVKLINGKAQGMAKITVSEDAVVGSTFSVTAGADNIESNALELTVSKVPVTGLTLSLTDDTDDKLHIGKTRTVIHEFSPSYATYQDVRYELYGDGLKYIESFDEKTGIIKAKDNIAALDVNSTVTIIAYSVDNPNAFDSVTVSLYIPTTVVKISATTPLGRTTDDNKPLAVANSEKGDTITLHTTVNGVDSLGLNYVIVGGREYVENGMVQSGGKLTLRPTSSWTEKMKVPHPEVKIRAAYSDGFDEISVSVYIPVESISFVNSVPTEVENNRSYNLKVKVLPEYATQLNDNPEAIFYSIGNLGADIANIDGEGMLVLPKSLTSKSSVINYSANLVNAWKGVDVEPLTHTLSIVPVYASAFKSIEILKIEEYSSDGVDILPSDVLQVKVEYTIDNVTDIDFSLSARSNMLSVSGSTINIAALQYMEENVPKIEVEIAYNNGGISFKETRNIFIYVPALSAEIADTDFMRNSKLNLKNLVTINGHGYASNNNIEWGQPTIFKGNNSISVYCNNGVIEFDKDSIAKANAGTVVRVPYRPYDSTAWQYKDLTVKHLTGEFTLEYGDIKGDNADSTYKVNYDAPQLEEGQSFEIHLNYNGNSVAKQFGLKYYVQVTKNNAEMNYHENNSNNAYDTFKLTANRGQSGKNNYIGYLITIIDGDATYYVHTEDFTVPTGSAINQVFNQISIFKRISGNLGVNNTSFVVGDSFELTGWDDTVSFDKNDLQWSLTNGSMEGKKVISAGHKNIVLNITAKQVYNNDFITYPKEITFSTIVYNNDGRIEECVYLKKDCSIDIKDRIFDKYGYIQTGWSKSMGGSKIYEFGARYSGYSDLTLFPYWVKTRTIVNITEYKDLDENQNKDKHTDEQYIDLNFKTLKELGYTKVFVYIDAILERTNHGGNHAKLWLDLNGDKIFTKNKFEPNWDKSSHCFFVIVDIDKFTENSKIRFGFYTYDDGSYGKFSWRFYEADVTFEALKN